MKFDKVRKCFKNHTKTGVYSIKLLETICKIYANKVPQYSVSTGNRVKILQF